MEGYILANCAGANVYMCPLLTLKGVELTLGFVNFDVCVKPGASSQ